MDNIEEITPLLEHAILAGLCPAIPIPLVDDAIENVLRRRMMRKLLADHGIQADDATVKRLTEKKSNFLLGCFTMLAVYPVKKLFRKVFFVLAIKDCVDEASRVLHEGYLLRHALRKGMVDQGILQAEKALHFKAALDRTFKANDPRPLNQILREAFGKGGTILRKSSSEVYDRLRVILGTRSTSQAEAAIEQIQQEEPPAVQELIDGVQARIWTQRGYLDALAKTFEKELSREPESATRGAAPRP